MYDILEGVLCAPEATRPDSRTTLQYVHSTLTWAHKSGPRVSHTHSIANAEHGGEGVVGGFAADRRLSEAPVAAAGYCYPRTTRRPFVSKDVSHALRGLCEGVSLLSPCY